MMKVAIYQSDGSGLSPSERLGKLATALHAQSLDLVVCPELFMSGYNVQGSFHDIAEPVDGPFSKDVCKVARQAGTTIVYGYPERCDGDVYNAAAAVDSNGALLANHRKLVIPPGIEEGWFASGSGLTLFNQDDLTFAILICYDAEFPEAARAACIAGADVILVPTALSKHWPQVAERVIPSRAFENGCWVLYANHAAEENGLTYLGQSCIVGPDGLDVQRADAREQLICAEIDKEKVNAARKRLPYFRDLLELHPRLGNNDDSW